MRSDIKLLVPSMPTADDLMPYLRRIDAAKVYVNHGPLVQELQSRLEQMTGAHVAIVSNCTVALELALKATNIKSEQSHFGDIYPYVLVPAMTFSATGLAAKSAGFGVELEDVDVTTWQLNSDNIDIDCIDAVMPVATFGTPVDVKQWEGYGVPVIIDAAGAFMFQEVSKDPNIATCFSLHATKFIGCGEGGFVASANRELVERVRSMASFGEDGTNAKMSEYHAAVALASLDKLNAKIALSASVRAMYLRHGNCYGFDLRFGGGTICNVLLPVPAAEGVPKMAEHGIETKQWYRPYLDERTEFSVPRGTFPVIDHLREHLLGLPFHNFMTEADVMHVCSTLRNILLEG